MDQLKAIDEVGVCWMVGLMLKQQEPCWCAAKTPMKMLWLLVIYT